mgnify:CR=1 FL=1
MSIKSNKNVNILFGVLSNEYPNILNDKSFMSFFNIELDNIYKNRYSIGSLQQQNKILLRKCASFYKNNKPMVLKKRDDINKGSFDDYINDYNKLLNPNKPTEIDFADTISDEPISNITNIMSQTLEDREKELSKITKQYNANNEWLKSEETRETPKLEILDNKKEKRVTFEISEKNENENDTDVLMLLNKLKKKQDKDELMDMNNNNKNNKNNENEILNKILNEITELKNNQKYIIDLLKKLTNNN